MGKDFKVNVKSVDKGHHKVTYRGVTAIKCPFDYVIYQMIITELKPDLIIEIGGNKGGGALYLADLLEIIGSGIIHTIDITDSFDPLVKNHSRIKTFTNGYSGYDTEQTKDFNKILVIEDASHLYDDCINCLHKFSPIVTKGSYYIVEDGIIDELGFSKSYQGGPKKAIKEFMKNNYDFIIDKKWCDMFGENATFNINGYLKRL
jgi:cephalosporin hydroxylase